MRYPQLSRTLLNLYLVGLLLYGCAHHPTLREDHPAVSRSSSKTGFYHVVKKGETLWRIARRYGVPLDLLVRVNRLPNPDRIIVGQRLWIPRSSPNSRPSRKDIQFIWPVKGKIIRYFSKETPLIQPGIDIAAPLGSEVVASMEGEVIFSGQGPGRLGKTIIIAHPSGFTTVYAYNLENLVSVKQKVKQGQRIARVGLPLKSSVPTLHFEIRRNTIPYDPLSYLPKREALPKIASDR